MIKCRIRFRTGLAYINGERWIEKIIRKGRILFDTGLFYNIMATLYNYIHSPAYVTTRAILYTRYIYTALIN